MTGRNQSFDELQMPKIIDTQILSQNPIIDLRNNDNFKADKVLAQIDEQAGFKVNLFKSDLLELQTVLIRMLKIKTAIPDFHNLKLASNGRKVGQFQTRQLFT